MTAKDIMRSPVITVTRETPILDILKTLLDNSISGIPVVEADGTLAGIVTEGDLLRKETQPRLPQFINILGGIIYFGGFKQYEDDVAKLMAQQAETIMTSEVITVPADMEVEKVAQILLDKKIKRVPVLENDKLIGIISRREIMLQLMATYGDGHE